MSSLLKQKVQQISPDRPLRLVASAQTERTALMQQFKAAKDAGLTTRYFQQTPQGGWKEAGV